MNPMNNSTLLQANASLKKGDFKTALRLYQEVISADPQNALAYENAAIAQGDLGNDSEALEMSTKALELDPSLITPHVTRAYVLDRLGKKEESRIEIRKALEKDPESPEALSCLGLFSLMDNKIDDARRYLQKAIEMRPSFYPAHYNLIGVYQSLNDARRFFRQTLILFRLKPNIENLLRIMYVFSRTYRLTSVLILVISAILSLWIGPQFILTVTILLVSISFLGGIFSGFLVKGVQWKEFIMNLVLGGIFGIWGLIFYAFVNAILSR